MARAVIVLFLMLSACSKGQIRSGETAFCSTSSSDDPQYICDPGMDLICLSTYSIPVTDPTEMRKWDGGVRPVYVCRLACEKSDDCPLAGDVCCPGAIYGKTYGKMAGCTPESLCLALLAGDGGAAERPPARPEAGMEALPRDAGAPDAPARDTAAPDAPPADAAAVDAAVDAVEADAS